MLARLCNIKEVWCLPKEKVYKRSNQRTGDLTTHGFRASVQHASTWDVQVPGLPDTRCPAPSSENLVLEEVVIFADPSGPAPQ